MKKNYNYFRHIRSVIGLGLFLMAFLTSGMLNAQGTDVPFELGINCGGDAYTAVDGTEYIADDYWTGGKLAQMDDVIANTDDQLLYQTYHQGVNWRNDFDFFYDIPNVPEGVYEITFKFADYNKWHTNIGNIVIEGNQVATELDIQGMVGIHTAFDTTFVVSVEDGELNIDFLHTEQQMFVNAILIEEVFEEYFSLAANAENGVITMDPAGGSYTSGTEVAVTVVPDYGFDFTGWIGDLEGVEDSTATTITVLMDQAKTITAEFVVTPMYTLSTNVENGNIIIKPAPDADGGMYYEGAEVQLTAQAHVGYEFLGWTGDASSAEKTITVLMDGDKNITADIQEIPVYSVNIVDATNGSVSLLPNQETYEPGSDVVISATADAGYRFAGWEGSLSGDQNPIGVTMDSTLNITAVFELIPESYTLATDATNGSVTLDPAGGTYEDGTEVTVTAVPDEGYEFTEWTGDLSGSDNPATITIDGDKSVTAVFEVITSTGVLQSNKQTNLGRNYPNPFSVETTIPYQLSEAVHVSLTIYNILGEKVNTLVNGHQPAGSYAVEWNVADSNGQLPNGIYFYRLVVDHNTVLNKRAAVINH